MDDEEPVPLWLNAQGKTTHSDVPPCSSCGGQRTAEFQVMPQILSLLNLDHADATEIDFGTIVIYSCAKSCDFNQTSSFRGFAEEFAWRQDFSHDGMGRKQQ
jgi:pre-rRNA-processing protein TSR4